MGRAGVTLQEVEKAVLLLQGRGKNPSVDAIRIETVNSVQLQELKQTLAKLHQDYSHLQKQFHQSEETRIVEQTAKEKFEKEFVKEQQEYAKLRERHQAGIQQLEDYKSENARLHQLANNIQANLEHYQNAMQQLRTEQNLAVEKQQIQFQQELVELQRELTSYRKQLKELEQQLNQKNTELQQLKEQYHFLQKNLSVAEDKIEMLREEKLFLPQEKARLEGHLKHLEKTSIAS